MTAEYDSDTPELPLEQTERFQQAWQHYRPIGSPSYEEANNQRVEAGKIAISDINGVRLVASINVDANGQTVSGHEHNPEADSIKDTKQAFIEWQEATPPEQRVLIYEGDERISDNETTAVTEAADSGLVQFLANQANIEAVPGEPTIEEEMNALAEHGVSKEEFLALDVARGVEATFANPDPNAVAGTLYHAAMRANIEGFYPYTQQEREAIMREGRMDEVMKTINDQAATLVPGLNEAYRTALEGKDLFVVENGTIHINSEYTSDNVGKTVIDKLTMTGDHRINEISRLDMEVRDRFIFTRIIEQYEQGKRLIVPYGGSHIVTIEPALRAYLGAK